MLQLAVEKGDGAFTNFLPLGGLPQVTEALDGAPEGFELLCRFFCLPGQREQVEPLARFMFASYVTVPFYEAFFRWLGYGEQIDEMVEAWKRKDRDARDRGGAVGADRGHLHLRRPRRDEGAAAGVRRGRDHAPDPDPGHDPGPVRRADRSARRPQAARARLSANSSSGSVHHSTISSPTSQ